MSPRIATLLSFLICLNAVSAAPVSFKAAIPVWPDTGGDDLNRRVGFRVALDALPADAVLRLATSGLYRATVDGKFLGHGPARAGHGHFRIDEWQQMRFALSLPIHGCLMPAPLEPRATMSRTTRKRFPAAKPGHDPEMP